MKFIALTPIALGLALAGSTIFGPALAHAGAAIVQEARRIEIDVLPHRKQNEVKLSEKDKSIQVVVMGEATFNVREIDPATVELAGATPVTSNGRRLDANLDEQGDIEYRFQIGRLALTDTTKTVCLTGKLLDGKAFRGCGEIIVKP